MKNTFVSEYIFPARIMLIEGNIKDGENLLKECPLQAGLSADKLISIEGKAKIVLDYGKEIQGGVKIVTHIADNATVNLRFGESADEAVAPLGYKNAVNDHSVRDFRVNLQNFSQTEYGNTGFRFLCLEFSGDKPLSLKAIAAVYRHRDLKEVGNFICDDELVNKIYTTAARTLSLCMQEMLWDGIKRDRLVWIGDMHTETLAINCLYGGDDIVKDALDFSINCYPLPSHMNFMPSYSLWFVLIVKDYFMQTGDVDFLLSKADYLCGLMKLLNSSTDEAGNLSLSGYFLDWPSSEHPDAVTGVKALALMAADAVIFLSSYTKKESADAIELKNKLLKGSFPVLKFKQAAAFKYLSQADKDYFPSEFLIKDGANGLSTFTSYYTLKSIAECGSEEDALKIMKDYFGAMLSVGATTFFEDFDIKWLENAGRIDEFTPEGKCSLHGDNGGYCYEGFRHSLCHGWSSGALPFLTHKILGVNILKAGCKEMEIKPRLGFLKFAKGVYPTPSGEIKIYAEKKKDKTVVDISAPKDIKILKD